MTRKMRIASNLCLMIVTLVAVACDSSRESFGTEVVESEASRFEIWSCAQQPIAHTGHAIAFDWDTREYLYWKASDVMSGLPDHYPKRGEFFIDEGGRIVLESVFDSEVVLKKMDLDGSKGLVVDGRDFEEALRSGLVLFNREHGDIKNPWSLSDTTSFEKKRVGRIMEEKGEGGLEEK